jgi:Fe2+ transport system protein FeoA
LKLKKKLAYELEQANTKIAEYERLIESYMQVRDENQSARQNTGLEKENNPLKDSLPTGRFIMVLSSIDKGKEVTLIAITGGRGIRSKLYSMGLVPGVKFTVLNRHGKGPVMVAVKDSRLAIGYGMAEKIIVE